MLISYTYIEQVRIHDSISHVRWAGALMEVRSLFGLIKKKTTLPTDHGPTDHGRTDPLIESQVRD